MYPDRILYRDATRRRNEPRFGKRRSLFHGENPCSKNRYTYHRLGEELFHYHVGHPDHFFDHRIPG